MKPKTLLLLIAGAWIAAMTPGVADSAHFWRVFSPDHEQTFACGMETNRVLKLWRGHFAILLTFTNDPYVDYNNPRQEDNFRFDFRMIRIGANGDTFYLHTDDGRRIPVASLSHDFLGFDEVRLLPNATLFVERPHGYITVHLDVIDPDGLATSR
jgi:hypothetical protein